MFWHKKRSPRCISHVLVALLALVVLNDAVHGEEITDFVSTNTLSDGEVETRIYYGGITAKETTVGKGSIKGIKLRELSDGKHIIQLIYDENDQLRDCEFGRAKDLAETFLIKFKGDLSKLIATSNVTVESLDGKKLPSEFSWFNYEHLKDMCKEKHKEIRRIVEKTAERDRQSSLHEDRQKRDVSDLFRVPGTKWCGKGFSADKYTRLGGFSRTDRCCRRHDLGCPFWIGGFETKYGLFNWRVNTLMHCNCDERFRACLKMVGTSDANLVGKLFFNVVQTKCFHLKPKKKCIRSSWWGKCEKYKMVKKAILRDNLPY